MAYRSLFQHKRGDTFKYSGAVSLPPGNWTGTAQVRLPTKIDVPPPIAELTVTLSDIPESEDTAIELYAPDEETKDWPLTLLICDVQFVDDLDPDTVVSTDTFGFTMIRDVTHDDPA